MPTAAIQDKTDAKRTQGRQPLPERLPLTPAAPPAEVFAAAAHALCRERKDLDDGGIRGLETDTAIRLLARHAPPSDAQRLGVRLARRIIDDIKAKRRAPADLSKTGNQRPTLADFIIAVTGNAPFTCRELVDRLSPYVRVNRKRSRATHNIHHAINADARFRRHERGVYTRIHHE